MDFERFFSEIIDWIPSIKGAYALPIILQICNIFLFILAASSKLLMFLAIIMEIVILFWAYKIFMNSDNDNLM